MTETYFKNYYKYLFIAIFILLLYLTILLVEPFFFAILTSLFLAYILYPLHKIIKKHIKNSVISSLVSTIGVLLVIVIPLAIIINLIVLQTYNLYLETDIDFLLTLLYSFIPSEIVQEYLGAIMENGLPYLITIMSSFVLSIPQKVINFFITLVILYYTFKNGDKLVHFIKEILPLESKKKDMLIKKFKSTIDGVFYGVLINALIQFILASIGFWILGVSAPLFWGMLVGILAMLPGVGPALVWAPLAIYEFIIGDIWPGFGLLFYGFFVLTLLADIVLRPKIIGWKGQIHPVVVLIGVIGGLTVFGLTGLILGPLILTVFLFFLDVYLGRQK